MQMTVLLDQQADWHGFRRQARYALQQAIVPDAIAWEVKNQATRDLFASDLLSPDDVSALPRSDQQCWRVPRQVMNLCETAILHNDPNRFALIYRFLWRLRQQPALAQDPLDADRMRLQDMMRSVHRDMHKMTAFVRFRPVQGKNISTQSFIAWFEPEHYIVRRIAPFFVRRFTNMQWAILTPDCSIRWTNGQLEEGPGVCRGDVPGLDSPGAEAGEAAWLTYYRHIFNPARLKTAMMQREMPCKYWRNLPEASLIPELTAMAAQRSGTMLFSEPTSPSRYAKKARAVSVRAQNAAHQLPPSARQ